MELPPSPKANCVRMAIEKVITLAVHQHGHDLWAETHKRICMYVCIPQTKFKVYNRCRAPGMNSKTLGYKVSFYSDWQKENREDSSSWCNSERQNPKSCGWE